MKQLLLKLFPWLAASVVSLPGMASAAVTGPDGCQLPGNTTVLQNFFDARLENIRAVDDAAAEPEVFVPLCGLTIRYVHSEASCQAEIGWYNYDPDRTESPGEDEIFKLLDKDASIGTPVTVDQIRDDPNYKGGLIGFALDADRGDYCRGDRFTERRYNPLCDDCDPKQSYISSLIYKSTVWNDAFYLAFEDRTHDRCTDDWDFNDRVLFVQGISCEGAGELCTVPRREGVCSRGRLDCKQGGGLECLQMNTPEREKCDGLDNDCNGAVDDGNEMCSQGLICNNGACVPRCGDVSFTCASGFACNDGVCVEEACTSVECDSGTVCRKGACVDACTGVNCPHPQICQLGRCVDPCEGKTCGQDQVCEEGVCVFRCDCRTCPDGKACDSGTGHCVEPGCENKSCPGDQVCSGGECVAPCDVATCPTGELCQDGACVPACDILTCEDSEKCVAGECVPLCKGIQCPAGQRCNPTAGACEDACAGVSCPQGEKCSQGSCIDACTGVTCPPGKVCTEGSCGDSCEGVICPEGEACHQGSCGNPCSTLECPDGHLCRDGACVDPCADITCADGLQCIGGECLKQQPLDGGVVDAGPDAGPDGGRATASDSASCGCRTVGSAGTGSLAGALALMGVIALRRRRAHAQ